MKVKAEKPKAKLSLTPKVELYLGKRKPPKVTGLSLKLTIPL